MEEQQASPHLVINHRHHHFWHLFFLLSLLGNIERIVFSSSHCRHHRISCNCHPPPCPQTLFLEPLGINSFLRIVSITSIKCFIPTLHLSYAPRLEFNCDTSIGPDTRSPTCYPTLNADCYRLSSLILYLLRWNGRPTDCLTNGDR
jgi:hypothetical protein